MLKTYIYIYMYIILDDYGMGPIKADNLLL